MGLCLGDTGIVSQPRVWGRFVDMLYPCTDVSVVVCVPLMVFVMQSTSTTVCHSDEACLHGTHCHQVYMLSIQCHVSLIMSLWLHLQVGGFVPGTVYTLVRLCRLLCLTLVYGCDSAGRGLWLCHCYP